MTYHLGTSGWSYPGWRGKFYPKDLASRDWLPFLARHFGTVEVNMTFYRFPKPETLQSWVERTPAQFTLTLKANRRITHLKKLRKVQKDVQDFYRLADALREKLGCILFQLPPSIILNLELLREFLAALSPAYRNVVEFRHESWYAAEVYELLKKRNVTFCTVSSAQVPSTVAATSPVAYFRFHGLTGGYRYNYSDEELRNWAEKIKTATAEDGYIYFNNDYQAYAVRNALKLGEYLQRELPELTSS
ncbi:MAG: DUF72 domain-containing protein [Candidatus Aminicenantes bacterium]|nr:DUF72 domain-containing protein [Candidatus Aminicenantes bacterium]